MLHTLALRPRALIERGTVLAMTLFAVMLPVSAASENPVKPPE